MPMILHVVVVNIKRCVKIKCGGMVQIVWQTYQRKRNQLEKICNAITESCDESSKAEIKDAISDKIVVEKSYDGVVCTGNDKKSVSMPLRIFSEKYSSVTWLLTVTAWCLRFIGQLKGRRYLHQCLTDTELKKAETMSIKAKLSRKTSRFSYWQLVLEDTTQSL